MLRKHLWNDQGSGSAPGPSQLEVAAIVDRRQWQPMSQFSVD